MTLDTCTYGHGHVKTVGGRLPGVFNLCAFRGEEGRQSTSIQEGKLKSAFGVSGGWIFPIFQGVLITRLSVQAAECMVSGLGMESENQ